MGSSYCKKRNRKWEETFLLFKVINRIRSIPAIILAKALKGKHSEAVKKDKKDEDPVENISLLIDYDGINPAILTEEEIKQLMKEANCNDNKGGITEPVSNLENLEPEKKDLISQTMEEESAELIGTKQQFILNDSILDDLI